MTRNEPQLLDGPSARPTSVRWLVLALACATSWMLYLHRYAWGVIKKDVQDEFGLTKTELGWLDSAFATGYALCQIPGGLLGDLWGPALVLPLMIAAWSLVVAAMVFCGGKWSLCGVRFLFGVAQAGTYPNLGKVTRNWFPLSVRTTMQGTIASLSGRAGGACAPLLVGTILMGWWGLGWRTSLLLLAAAGVLFALVFRLLFRDSPAEHPWSNAAEQRLIEGEEPPARRDTRFSFTRRWTAWASFSFLLAHIFLSAFADMLYVNWIPQFLLEDKGLTRQAMGVFAMLPLLGGAIGGMFGGVANDLLIRATGNRKLARRAVGMVGKVTAAALVVWGLSVDDGRWMMVVVAGAKFFTDWSQPTVWGAITDISGPAAGRVFGTVNMSGSIGGIVSGPVLGWIIEVWGWDALFWTIAGVYVLSGLCWLAIDVAKRLVVESPVVS